MEEVQEEEVVTPGGTPVPPDKIVPGMILSVTTVSPKLGKFIVLHKLSNENLQIALIARTRRAFKYSQSVLFYCQKVPGYVSLGIPEEISKSDVSKWEAMLIKKMSAQRLGRLLNDVRFEWKPNLQIGPSSEHETGLLEPNKELVDSPPASIGIPSPR